MNVQDEAITILFRRDYAVNWVDKNPILGKGEPGVEKDNPLKFKIGDGVTRWVDLDYFVGESYITTMIALALADVGVGDNGASLTAHIVSPTPHPVYDDGPSLELLYQNKKV